MFDDSLQAVQLWDCVKVVLVREQMQLGLDGKSH